MNVRNITWWGVFFPVALVCQGLLPGLDALVIGLIIVLQERSYKNLIWLLPVLILLQEGVGTRDFGGMILWYTAVMCFFMLGRWLFEVENVLFILLLSLCLGIAHAALNYVMAPLQNLHVNFAQAVDGGVMQAVFIPIAWRLAWYTREFAGASNDNG